MSFSTIGNNPYWRPGELQACVKNFGENILSGGDVLIIRNNTEGITLSQSLQYLSEEKRMHPRSFVVNSMDGFPYTACKLECFGNWKSNSIPHPKFVEFASREQIEESGLEFPYLIRLNNLATGEGTYLIESDADLELCLPKLISDRMSRGGYTPRMFAVQFVDTRREGRHISYRIAVAGDKVVSAYARIGDSWLAITAKFKESHKSIWLQENKRIQRIVKDNNDEICRAVSSLGLDHQGVDLILDSEENLYFIEVQPFYFCGDTNRTTPPFWNPYKPKELVDWLVNEKNDLYREIPEYYDNWLDKEAHFNIAYEALRKRYDVWSKSRYKNKP